MGKKKKKHQIQSISGNVYIGIDNGITGSIGIIKPDDYDFFLVPAKKELNYTKNKQLISRIDVVKLQYMLEQLAIYSSIKAGIERPMVNPARFKATTSALRALEATLIVLEQLNISYEYVDSKAWQKMLLPSGINGSNELKKASYDIGMRLFPKCKDKFRGDADGLLIAEYLRRKYAST